MKDTIIKTGHGVVQIQGSTAEIISALVITMDAMLKNHVCDKEDLLRCVDLAAMSDREFLKEIDKTEASHKETYKKLEEVKNKIMSGEITPEEASDALFKLLDKEEGK